MEEQDAIMVFQNFKMGESLCVITQEGDGANGDFSYSSVVMKLSTDSFSIERKTSGTDKFCPVVGHFCVNSCTGCMHFRNGYSLQKVNLTEAVSMFKDNMK